MPEVTMYARPATSTRIGTTADNAASGGLVYSTPAVPAGGFSFSAVNGGFNFDMPLASVAMFNNQALSFVKSNSTANRQFVDNSRRGSEGIASGANKATIGLFKSGLNNIYNLGKSGQQFQFDAAINAQNLAPQLAQINVQNTQAANSGGWCFITTAICELDQLPDNCYELETFRKFRDDFMRSDPQRSAMVDEYYQLAPKICGRLKNMPDKGAEIYQFLKYEFLYPALKCIELHQFDAALFIYQNMVKTADAMSRGTSHV